MIDTRIVLLSLLFTVSGVSSDSTTSLPQNKAVLKGTANVTFNCFSSQDWTAIGWSVMRVGESVGKGIANGNNVYASYRDVYEVYESGNGVNTLAIKTTNESLAGIYSCSEPGAAIIGSSQLIIYNSDPVCTSNASSVQMLNQGQSVQMFCSFSYTANSSFVGVNMAWSKASSSSSSSSSSSPVESPTPVYTTTGTLTTAVSTINQMVGYTSSFPVYQCQTSFNRVSGGTATNIPAYSSTAQPFNTTITVYYFNPNCSITGAQSDGSIYLGGSMSCSTDSNPPPSYRWSNGTNATLSNNSTVLIFADGQYTCTASNGIGNCQNSINLTTRTTTMPPTTTTTTTITPPTTTSRPATPGASGDQPPGSAESNSEGGGLTQATKNIIIGVVVGVGGAILLVLLIVIICCCIKKKKSAERYKEDRNVKPMVDYPPPYEGHVGPQRNSSPDVTDYPHDDYPHPNRSSYAGSSPAHPYVVDDGLNYAQIQLDNKPRSRQPLQVPQTGNYVDVALA